MMCSRRSFYDLEAPRARGNYEQDDENGGDVEDNRPHFLSLFDYCAKYNMAGETKKHHDDALCDVVFEEFRRMG